MTGLVVWCAIVAVVWWWGTRPAGRSRQDRADLARIRARQRRVIP